MISTFFSPYLPCDHQGFYFVPTHLHGNPHLQLLWQAKDRLSARIFPAFSAAFHSCSPSLSWNKSFTLSLGHHSLGSRSISLSFYFFGWFLLVFIISTLAFPVAWSSVFPLLHLHSFLPQWSHEVLWFKKPLIYWQPPSPASPKLQIFKCNYLPSTLPWIKFNMPQWHCWMPSVSALQASHFSNASVTTPASQAES